MFIYFGGMNSALNIICSGVLNNLEAVNYREGDPEENFQEIKLLQRASTYRLRDQHKTLLGRRNYHSLCIFFLFSVTSSTSGVHRKTKLTSSIKKMKISTL